MATCAVRWGLREYAPTPATRRINPPLQGRCATTELCDRWHFTDGAGKAHYIGQSVGHLGHRILKGQGHPSGAWAARREIFPLDVGHILGGGDTTCVEAWLKMVQTFAQSQMTPARKAHWERGAQDAQRKERGRITTLQGEAVHLFHGTRDNRRYSERTQWLFDHDYNPDRDIRVDQQGLLTWTAEAPKSLQDVVRNYFLIRREDG